MPDDKQPKTDNTDSDIHQPDFSISDDNEEKTTPEKDELTPEARELAELNQVENEAASEYRGSEPDTAPKPEAEPLEPVPALKKRGFKAWVKAHKKTVIFSSLGALVVIAALVIWFTDLRYSVMNLFGQAKVQLTIRDQKTKLSVPKANVTIGDKTGQADDKGVLALDSVPYGNQSLRVTKTGYADAQQAQKITHNNQTITVELQPTGTPIALKVVNKLTGAPLANAALSFEDSDATSDDKGAATLVVPPSSQTTIKVAVKAKGYNDATLDVKTDSDRAQTLSVTPEGSLYFLSKRTGTINVMRSDLDGGNQTVLLQGTGKESDAGTVLLASRDWSFLALLARRDDTPKAKLYLINTRTKAVSQMETEAGDITLAGWHGRNFIYALQREGVENWKPKAGALKSFNADTRQGKTLHETDAVGDSQATAATQSILSPYIVKNGVVFGVTWNASSGANLADKQQAIYSIGSDGSNKKTVAQYPTTQVTNLVGKLYEPNGIYYGLYGSAGFVKTVAVENGAAKDTNISGEDFSSRVYNTYLLSPSGNKTLWSESRDGKLSVLVGDGNGQNAKTILAAGDYTAYGWFGDEYVLLSKNKSELYILNAAGGAPLKVSDYHKPDFSSIGYGYGYGGF